MVLKLSAPDGVKVYNVTSSKNQPKWLSDKKKKKSLRKDEEYRSRIELVQDLEFPAACHRLKLTPDGEYLFATGIHAPRVRVYELGQLSLKFERHFDAEVVDFQILSEDYSKVAFLCADRSVHLHAKYGAHFRTRVPRYGRDLAYAPDTADLLIAASSSDIYRLNLAEGCFYAPLQSASPGVNACAISPADGLFAAAGEGGLLECFDLRQRRCAGALDAAAAAGAPGEGLTAVRFDEGGLTVAVGTSNGLVALFDLRAPRPSLIKDHMYGAPIRDIKFHASDGIAGGSTRRVISADRHIVRVWDAASGSNFTSIQPPEPGINDVLHWRGSGLLMLGMDQPNIEAYFVPSLGPAPKWCSFLEGLTEELEENASPTLYDDYRFVTKAELGKLGLGHLVGTPLLRAFMHGYFLHNRLYAKARALAEPFAYEAYRAERVAAKLNAERQSRIGLVRRLPKVNASLAARVMAAQGDEPEQPAGNPDAPAKRSNRKPGSDLLQDERFRALFEDKSFAIDERSEEYKALHPNADVNKRQKQLLEEHFQELATVSEQEEEDEGVENEEGTSSMEEQSDDDREPQRGQRGRGGSKEGDVREAKRAAGGERQGGGGPRMFAARDDAAAAAFRARESLAELQSVPLAERAQASDGVGPRPRLGGQRELTFVPRGSGSRGRGRGRGRGREGRGGGGGAAASFGGSDERGGGKRYRSSGGRGGRGRGRGGSRGSGRFSGGGGGRKRGRH